MRLNYSLISQNKLEDGEFFKVVINIPTINGWVDNVYLNILGNNYFLPFKVKKDQMATFEREIFIKTGAIHRFNFSYNIEGKTYHTNSDKISSNFSVPKWAKGAVMYQIFVDRFNRGNPNLPEEIPNRKIYSSFAEEMKSGPTNGIWNIDYYGGDLKGIIDKLDYIKSLGVSIIYLTPIVRSQSNHRYDTGDYEIVDPYVGTNDDLKMLCDEAHKREIRIVLDAVFNHTGNDSKYFNEFESYPEKGAAQGEESDYYKFYKRHNNGFCYWWGMNNLPVCDSSSQEWTNYITGDGDNKGIIDKWFELGIDGLRLDVADELSDTFIEKIRSAVRRNKEDGFVIGEVWENPMSQNRKYVSSGTCMDSVMNYYFIDALMRYFKYGDVDKLVRVIKDIQENYPEDTIKTLMNFTSTHDISRIINIFGTDEFDHYAKWAWDLKKNELEYCKSRKLSQEEEKRGKEIYKAYLFALAFYPGILSIFYGDEIGITGMGNLENRKPFRDETIDQDLLEFHRFIGKIREDNPFLKEASLHINHIDKNLLYFTRRLGTKYASVLVSNSPNNLYFEKTKVDDKVKTYNLNSSDTVIMPYGAVALVGEGKEEKIKVKL